MFNRYVWAVAPRIACALGLLLLLRGLATAEEPAKKPPEAKPAAEKAEPEGSKFVRLQRDENKYPIAMETAIVRYIKPAKDGEPEVIVDLVGAVHVGDSSYYRQLNREFKQYDALLYELVAPEGTKLPKRGSKGKSSHPLGMLQDGMSEVLELKHQLDQIDYHKDNFVHADMSPDDFSKSMEERGESFLSMFFNAMGYSMAQQSKKGNKMNDAALLAALFSSNRPLALKRLMSEQLADLETSMGAFDGPKGSTIITERNKVAMKVLADQIKAGKTKLGIFYGAGHLPDMEKRLLNEFGFKRDSDRWLTAWDMRLKTPARKAASKAEAPKATAP